MVSPKKRNGNVINVGIEMGKKARVARIVLAGFSLMFVGKSRTSLTHCYCKGIYDSKGRGAL